MYLSSSLYTFNYGILLVYGNVTAFYFLKESFQGKFPIFWKLDFVDKAGVMGKSRTQPNSVLTTLEFLRFNFSGLQEMDEMEKNLIAELDKVQTAFNANQSGKFTDYMAESMLADEAGPGTEVSESAITERLEVKKKELVYFFSFL